MEKEIKKEKKVRQYRSRQGRSDRQYQSNMKVMFLALAGMVIMLIGTMLYNVIKDLF